MTKKKLKKKIDELEDRIRFLVTESLSHMERKMLLEIRERELSKQLEQSKQKYAVLLERHIRLLEDIEGHRSEQ